MRRRSLGFAAAGLAVLAAPWLLLRPSATPSTDAAAAPPRRVEYVVRHGALQSGPTALRVVAGTRLVLVVDSDRDDELHLHGYELELPLRAHRPGELPFEAAHAGHYALELHGAGLELGTLDVVPR